ncbi:MAG: TrmH family RNA methyltransferase [Bacteroidetes bacterium]|nr:TrmH family RNA methyltransferase [Bacteroidota bacterium]MBU1371248.1 TrmH family RNA methyltransferase [Bacteroidota bacterium]MBU1485735.1 TrmH family RNA methyltransferase [Bacteroidota bacterium]MBU1759577.1 TrmH family RNA methyltransferase [Bacteroidota bacterium]MBU2045801.1 TrmH family RNA methyltransferase [Bacteroidota bacterium]
MRKLKLDELNRVSVEEFKEQQKLPVIVVLDHVRSLNNVGSAFRTADGFAIEAIYLCGITAQPPHREIEKTAIGATQSIEWKYFENVIDAVNHLKENHFKIIAIEQAESSISLSDFIPKKNDKYAFFFGNEVNGVSEEVMQNIDSCIEIPQFGTKHSFNIVISMGIVLWDFYSKFSKL